MFHCLVFSKYKKHDFHLKHFGIMVGITVTQIIQIYTYSQTCLMGSPEGRAKRGCLRQVTLNTGSFALYFGSRDPEKVAA